MKEASLGCRPVSASTIPSKHYLNYVMLSYMSFTCSVSEYVFLLNNSETCAQYNLKQCSGKYRVGSVPNTKYI